MAATIVICVVLAVICVYAVVSYRKKLKNGCCGSGGDTVKKIRPRDNNTDHYPHKAVVYINGMTCENCAARVENAFNAKEGFYAKVNLRKKCADVWCMNEPDDKDMRQTVMRSGYTPMQIMREK